MAPKTGANRLPLLVWTLHPPTRSDWHLWVGQSCTLLDRRVALGMPFVSPAASFGPARLQIADLRYGRLQICATKQADTHVDMHLQTRRGTFRVVRTRH